MSYIAERKQIAFHWNNVIKAGLSHDETMGELLTFLKHVDQNERFKINLIEEVINVEISQTILEKLIHGAAVGASYYYEPEIIERLNKSLTQFNHNDDHTFLA